MRDLYTRSPDIPGPPKSLHRSSLQDLFTRPLWEISIQDLLISLNSEIFSLQDLFKRPRSGSNTQKVPRGLRGRNQNRHRATARAIRHGRTPQRVARAETKNAPGWAPATFHQQNEHGATARAIRHAQSPERVAFANIKSAPRHSETQKIRVPTAPWRQNYNTKCDFSMFCDASTAPATKKWVRGIRSPVTATRHDVNIADPNSTTVSQNEHFELSKTDFKSTKYCPCHEKWRFFTTSNFEQLTTILHTSQNPHVLHISRFPKIDTARRRERTSKMDLVAAPFRAGEMHFFDLDHNFSPRGSPKNPRASAHTTDLHQMLFHYRKNPIVWPHCLGKYVGKGCQKICQTRMSEDMPERMSIDMSEHMSDKNCKRCVRNMSDKTVKTYVTRIVRQECQKICQKECQKECQKLCQKRMSEDMSEDMSEKNVRKNVRIGFQKRWQKICQKRMSEDMPEKDVRRYVRRDVTKNVSIERSLLNSRRLGAWRLTRPAIY